MGNRRKRVAVDTSIAIKWVTSEDDTPAAQVLLDNWLKQNFLVIAPDLLLYEITNAFYKLIRKNELTLEKAIQAFQLLMETNMNFEVVTDEKLSLSALAFTNNHKLPATYDAHYLALAEREQCEFWTADARLYHAVREQLAWVRLMADDPAASTPA